MLPQINHDEKVRVEKHEIWFQRYQKIKCFRYSLGNSLRILQGLFGLTIDRIRLKARSSLLRKVGMILYIMMRFEYYRKWQKKVQIDDRHSFEPNKLFSWPWFRLVTQMVNSTIWVCNNRLIDYGWIFTTFDHHNLMGTTGWSESME